jgi:hypothetical protein
MTDVLADAMKSWPQSFLISWNIANKSALVTNPHPAVSLFNFHYAAPPETVAMNWGLNKPIGDNETGFRGTNDLPYRTEAWDFILAGGALFNHLDYSFVVGKEDGMHQMTAKTPGGGSPTLRRQFAILRRFMDSFNFTKMKPDTSIVVGGAPSGGSVRGLAEEGRAYALYVRKGKAESNEVSLQVSLPAGRWRMEWVDTKTGKSTRANVDGGKTVPLNAPAFETDIALRITRR